MKKILFAIAIVLTMGLTANAQRDAFFKWTDADNELLREPYDGTTTFNLPYVHNYEQDVNAPLGSGLLVLTALGGAYALMRRQKLK